MSGCSGAVDADVRRWLSAWSSGLESRIAKTAFAHSARMVQRRGRTGTSGFARAKVVVSKVSNDRLGQIITTRRGGIGGWTLAFFARLGRSRRPGPHYRVVGIKPGSALTVRVAPSPAAAKIGAIPYNADGLRNLGCQGGLSFTEWEKASPARRAASRNARWCRISDGAVTGWVAGRFLGEGNAPRAKP